jgi:hypothetical protein
MKMNKIGWILGMALLLIAGLISCEKEALDGEITIRFSLGDGAYGTDETRGTGLEERDLEAETVVVPVEGVLHMYATLEEEPTLRAAGDEVMEIGTKIIIAAYNDVGTYVTQAEYEVTNTTGGIKPTAADGIGLTITTAGDYTFVAYSLSTTSSFSYSDNMGPYSANNAGDDPLWGASEKVTVSAGMNRVNIGMRHVFSRVTLKASSSNLTNTPLITDLSAVLVGYKAMIQDGALGKGDAEEQAFVFPSYNATTVTSNQRVVYAGGEDITVIKIVSATIGGVTHTGSLAWFRKKLLPGRSYILNVKFDELEWAGSNIYWVTTSGNNGYLTFDATDKGNQGYQGVFFKWGSLVGISPAAPLDFSSSVAVYIPSGSGWTTSSYAAWTDIPVWDNATCGDVIDDTRYESFRGDICRYLGTTNANLAGYRLPKYSELGTATQAAWNTSIPAAGGWIKGTASWPSSEEALTGTGKADGTTDLLKPSGNVDGKIFGSAVNQKMNVTLPAGSTRTTVGTLHSNEGMFGHYWCDTANRTTGAWLLRFESGYVQPHYDYNDAMCRHAAFSVRCVRN